MTKQEQKEVQTYKDAIRYIKRGFGKSHIEKHTFDFLPSCGTCQATFAVGFLEEAIDEIELWKIKRKSPVKKEK